MARYVKVYNKGTRPIVWKSSLKGREVIHPGKFDLFNPELARQIIDKFTDAVSEEEFRKPAKKEKAGFQKEK